MASSSGLSWYGEKTVINMRLRYKEHPDEPFQAHSFNVHAACPDEVLTGDDTVPVPDLDAFIETLGEWKDMAQAFRDRDIIPDNYNRYFMEPKTPEQRERGWY